MKPRVLALIAVLLLVVAACTGDVTEQTTTTAPAATTTAAEPTTTAAGEETTTTADDGAAENPLAEFGEDPSAADTALIEKALGPVTPSDDESWNIILASIARAEQDLDQATIDTAIACYTSTIGGGECETGSGGEVVMGYADGGGLNVWRQVTRMEAILQALTYPEIGTIVFRDAQWLGPDEPIADVQFMIEREVTFIIGYPDWGGFLSDVILAAEAAGIPYMPYSAGYVGLPDDGGLIPGEDYLGIVGEDLCALGESFAEVINANVEEGTIGVLGGTTGNALSAGWQRCHIPALSDSIAVEGPADTNWDNAVALEVVSGWLSANPDIAGFSYEYADGLYTALNAYEDLQIPFPENLTIALRTDEQTLFCDWDVRDVPGYRLFFSAGGNFQSRVAVTAQMLNLQGYEIPGEIIVPHVMREVTSADCNPDRVTGTVSNTSLVPDEVLVLMYPEG